MSSLGAVPLRPPSALNLLVLLPTGSCPPQRLDRILVDHLLRSGHHEAAVRLCSEAGIEQLCDIHVFEEARKVRQTGTSVRG